MVIGLSRSGSPICLSLSIITDRIGGYEVLLLLTIYNYYIYNYYNFREKKKAKLWKKGKFFLNYNFEFDWLI